MTHKVITFKLKHFKDKDDLLTRFIAYLFCNNENISNKEIKEVYDHINNCEECTATMKAVSESLRKALNDTKENYN